MPCAIASSGLSGVTSSVRRLARHGTIFKPDWRVYGVVAARCVLMIRSVRYRFVYAGVAALVWQMERIRWCFGMRKAEGGDGKVSWQWGLATALQQAQVACLVGALFVGIAYQPFIFMLIGLRCAQWSYVKRTEAAPQGARSRRPDGEKALPVAG